MQPALALLFAAMALALPLPAAEPPQPVRLVVEIEPQVDLGAPQPGKLSVRPLESKVVTQTLPIGVGRPAPVELPGEGRWEIRVDLPGAFVRGTVVEAGRFDATQPLRLPAWPWAEVVGRLKVPAQEKIPKELTLTTVASPLAKRGAEVPKGVQTCSVDEGGRFACAVPAATYDLGLKIEGYTPLYRWGVAASAKKSADLGLLALARGASVAGWVTVEEGAIEAGCVATLRPAVGGSSGSADKARVREASQEVRVRQDGFFQLVDVRPGIYSLEVHQPGRARAVLRQIEVAAGLESFVREPLLLRVPLRLEVHLDPPLDWLGKPWEVQVVPDAGPTGEIAFESIFEGTASAEGLVEAAGLTPQTIRILVNDSRGNRALWKRGIEVLNAAQARIDLRIELLTVHGTLRLGKRPIAGTLWFGGRYGSPRFEIPAGEDGKFVGVVSRPGAWRLFVDSGRPPVAADLEVDIRPDRQGRAELDVTLPDTRLFGQVVDDLARPLPEARLDFLGADGQTEGRSGADGRFEIFGLGAGLLEVVGSLDRGGERWVGTPASVSLSDGMAVGPIQIKLRRTKALSGIVVSSNGPVPGANVAVFAQSPPLASSADRQVADLNGAFSVAIDPVADRVSIEVMAPGYAYQVFSAPTSHRPTLTLTSQAGTLQVEFPPPGEGAGGPSRALLFQNGTLLRGYGQWLAMHAAPLSETSEGKRLDRMTLPEMAPGTYHVCNIPRDQLPAWHAAGGSPEERYCVEGTLQAGATLRLRLPDGAVR